MSNEIGVIPKMERLQGGVSPVGRPAPSRKAQAPSRFETLLGEVTEALESLKLDARGEKRRLSPESIQKPEDLQQALTEAGQKYRSCVKAGRHLVQAYQATMKGLDNSPP
ncbi:MAG: hypothetical protein KJ645_01635 [Planctomycetes bacterium]|nr:hypothetical protein [Planctomycetota bacterium]